MATVRDGKIDEFRPQVANANGHTPDGMGMLEGEMGIVGYVAPMTAAANGEMIDGSARLEASAQVFGGEVLVVEHDGTKPIVMVRTDVVNAETDQATRSSIGANRVAQANLNWQTDVLATYPPQVVEAFWTKQEIADWGTGDDDQEGATSDGSLLELVDVAIKDPRHEVHDGQVYTVGPHVLIIADVFRDWAVWGRYLKPGAIFAPFPGPFVALADQKDNAYLVMVQPDHYIAGHILDYWEDVKGPEGISLIAGNFAVPNGGEAALVGDH